MEKLQWQPCPLCHPAMALGFYGSLGFLSEHSRLQASLLPSPQAVSSQPTAAPFMILLSSLRIPAPIPMCTGGPCLKLGFAGLWTICVALTLCCLSAQDWLLCSPLGPQSCPSVPTNLPACEGRGFSIFSCCYYFFFVLYI